MIEKRFIKRIVLFIGISYLKLISFCVATRCADCAKSSVTAQFYDYECPPGYSYDPDTESCTMCVSGETFKPEFSSDVCSLCPKGPEVKSCDIYNFYCNPGYERTYYQGYGACTACVPGVTFSVNQFCVSCPSFSSCDVYGYACWVGYQKKPGADMCERCPSGSYKDTQGNTLCKTCPSNSLCTPTDWDCNAGFEYKALLGTCSACPLNTFKSQVGNEDCTACPLNAKCTTTTFECNPGYQNSPGLKACEMCPVNTFKSFAGNVPCDSCPVGSMCNSTSVINCLPGYYWHQVWGSCRPCPSQSFKATVGLELCTSCNQLHVSFCNATDMWCKAGYQLQDKSCRPCPSGAFKSSDDGSLCQKCPMNADCTSTRFTCLPGSLYDANGNQCSYTATTLSSTSPPPSPSPSSTSDTQHPPAQTKSTSEPQQTIKKPRNTDNTTLNTSPNAIIISITSVSGATVLLSLALYFWLRHRKQAKARGKEEGQWTEKDGMTAVGHLYTQAASSIRSGGVSESIRTEETMTSRSMTDGTLYDESHSGMFHFPLHVVEDVV